MSNLFLRYPNPAGKHVYPTNNVWQSWKPGTSSLYAVGRAATSTTWRHMHGGSDIKPHTAGFIGDSVYPVRPGTVYKTGNIWGIAYGNQVLVQHKIKDRYGKIYVRYSFYAHLNTIKVKPGQVLTINTRIGTMGRTGGVTGPHTHFAWQTTPKHKDGVIDPYPFLEAARLAS